MELKEEVERLIAIKKEGTYWDFKQCWYPVEKKGDMLHDIICFANNLVNRDCYIIIGVKDRTFEIVGVDENQNRKNTQNIIDFLKDKKFLGDYRPDVIVEKIMINEKNIDVIVIKNSTYTPFVLKADYEPVRANYIYTRIQDTNTPIDKSADYDKVKMLWEKRFGLNLSIMERFHIVLNEDDWYNSLGNKNYMYSKKYPEYHIELDPFENDDTSPIRSFYQNKTFSVSNAKCYYNNTLIYETKILSVDEFRKFITLPNEGKALDREETRFLYYILNSIEGKLLKIICKSLDLKSREIIDIPILIFKTEEEKDEFLRFTENRKIKKQFRKTYSDELNYDDSIKKGRLGVSAKEMVDSYEMYKEWKNQK